MCTTVAAPAKGGVVEFTDFLDVTTANNGLFRIGSGGWGEAGAVSSSSIVENSTVVGVKFQIGNTFGTFMLGLAYQNNLAFHRYHDIDFAFYIHQSGNVAVYESGRGKGNLYYGYTTSTVFEIRVVNNKVEYSIDQVVIYTSSSPIVYPLVVDASIAGNTYGSKGNVSVTNITWSEAFDCSKAPDCGALHRSPCYKGNVCGPCFAGTTGVASSNTLCNVVSTPTSGGPVLFTDLNNVIKTSTNGLFRDGTGSLGQAGAVSAASITNTTTSAVGVQFQAGGTDGYLMMGLAYQNRLSYYHYGDIDYAFYLQGTGSVSVYESGSHKGEIYRGYTPSTMFSVRVIDGHVEYSINRAVVYTSKTPARFPLVVDVSFASNRLGSSGNSSVANVAWAESFSCAAAGVSGDCSLVSRAPCYDNNVCGSCFGKQ